MYCVGKWTCLHLPVSLNIFQKYFDTTYQILKAVNFYNKYFNYNIFLNIFQRMTKVYKRMTKVYT